MLRELGDLTGLADAVSGAVADTYSGPWLHDPGRVFCDVAAAVADGADCVSGIASLRDRPVLHGPVASTPTAWRLVDRRIDAAHLPRIKAAGRRRENERGPPGRHRSRAPRWSSTWTARS
jgi:hypothetical protein